MLHRKQRPDKFAWVLLLLLLLLLFFPRMFNVREVLTSACHKHLDSVDEASTADRCMRLVLSPCTATNIVIRLEMHGLASAVITFLHFHVRMLVISSVNIYFANIFAYWIGTILTTTVCMAKQHRQDDQSWQIARRYVHNQPYTAAKH